MIEFTVESEPIAQPRQRHRIAGKGRKQFVQNYIPADHPVHEFKLLCRFAAKGAHAGEPLDGPLAVAMEFTMPRPESEVWKTRPMPRHWHAKKPDGDNLAKAVLDSLNGVLWADDSQVAELRITKHVAAGHERPGVRVSVQQLVGADQGELVFG